MLLLSSIGFCLTIYLFIRSHRQTNTHTKDFVVQLVNMYKKKEREEIKAYGSISPRKTVLSDEPEAIIGSCGWKSTSLTLPKWPGKR